MRCWVFHRWGRWNSIRIAYWLDGDIDSYASGQKRICARCGLEQIRHKV